MRFLKSIHWQRALHKRQVFLLPPGVPTAVWGWRGVRGPRSRYLQTKAILMARSGLHRPHPLHLHLFRHCLSAPQRSWVSPPPVYISGPGSWAPLAPRETVVSSSRRQSLPRRPPPRAPSFGTATGARGSPNRSAGLKSDSSGSGQSSRAREEGAALGLKLG